MIDDKTYYLNQSRHQFLALTNYINENASELYIIGGNVDDDWDMEYAKMNASQNFSFIETFESTYSHMIDVSQDVTMEYFVTTAPDEIKDDKSMGMPQMDEQLYIFVYCIAIATMILFMMTSYCCHKFYFMKLFAFFRHLLDVLSDILFCIAVWDSYHNGDGEDLLLYTLGIACIVCIVLPALINLFHLNREMKQWIEQDASASYDSVAWLNKYAYVLYFIAFIVGQSYVALELFESHLFGIRLFSFELDEVSRLKFQYKTTLSTAILENIPQLIMSALFLFYSPDYNIIAFISLVFSVSSVVSTFCALSTRYSVMKWYSNSLSAHVQTEIDLSYQKL